MLFFAIAESRGLISLRCLWLSQLTIALVYIVAHTTFLWGYLSSAWLEGVVYGIGTFALMLLIAEIAWRLSGHSILGELLTGKRKNPEVDE